MARSLFAVSAACLRSKTSRLSLSMRSLSERNRFIACSRDDTRKSSDGPSLSRTRAPSTRHRVTPASVLNVREAGTNCPLRANRAKVRATFSDGSAARAAMDAPLSRRFPLSRSEAAASLAATIRPSSVDQQHRLRQNAE